MIGILKSLLIKLFAIYRLVGKCYYNTMRKQEKTAGLKILRNYYVRASKYISMFTA